MVERLVDRKANTTSSMYISSTISSPNIKSIIKAISTIIHSQILEVATFLFLKFFRIKQVERD